MDETSIGDPCANQPARAKMVRLNLHIFKLPAGRRTWVVHWLKNLRWTPEKTDTASGLRKLTLSHGVLPNAELQEMKAASKDWLCLLPDACHGEFPAASDAFRNKNLASNGQGNGSGRQAANGPSAVRDALLVLTLLAPCFHPIVMRCEMGMRLSRAWPRDWARPVSPGVACGSTRSESPAAWALAMQPAQPRPWPAVRSPICTWQRAGGTSGRGASALKLGRARRGSCVPGFG